MRTGLLLLAVLCTFSAACEAGPASARGRILLQPEAARELRVNGGLTQQMDSGAVPLPVRQRAMAMRHDVEGGAAGVRYFPAGDGRVLALIPSWSFEGEDPHVIASFERSGKLIGVEATYATVRMYCPAEGVTGRVSSSHDAADGCRYFHPVLHEAELSAAPE